MTIEQQLSQFGLNQSEIRVYILLLENGLSSPPQVAKGTRIARTNCYHVLDSLKNQGLITEQQEGKRKAYLASDPEALLRSFDARRDSLASIVPDLRARYTVQKNKPKIRFYEGFEEVKQIYWQTYEAAEVFAIGSTKQLNSLQSSFLDAYAKGLKEKEIMLHDILSTESGTDVAQSMKDIMKGYYEFFVVPNSDDEFQTDILIWNDSIALISLGEPIFGTLLTNAPLAKTFRTLFRVMEDGLRDAS